MKKIALTILLLLFGLGAFATAQIPDEIRYKGEKYMLFTNPLASFFEENPEKSEHLVVSSTALWRGYIAKFEIVDDELLLEDVLVAVNMDSLNSISHELFPEGGRVKIDWMSGLLVLPYGECVNYVHMGYGSTYSKYILLEISEGNLTRELKLDHREYEAFKERQFKAFKKTDEYKAMKEEIRGKHDMSDKMIDDFLKSFVVDFTSKILD